MIGDAFVRANVDPAGGALKSQLTFYSNVTERQHLGDGGLLRHAAVHAFNCRSVLSWRSLRRGISGRPQSRPLRRSRSSARAAKPRRASTSQNPESRTTARSRRSTREQVTNSIFAEHRIDLFQRLDLTLGGRIDAIEGGQTFDDLARDRRLSYRRDRNEAARQRRHRRQGGDALSALQPLSAIADLAPEQSFGVDAGVDQKLFDDRATVSATVFDTQISAI